MKRIEAIIGHHTAQLPAWLNSRSVLIGGALVGALLVGAAGAFCWWEHRNAIADEEASAAMLARALDDESSRAFSTANTIASALADTLVARQPGRPADAGGAPAPRSPAELDTLLTQAITGTPVVRSLSLVDSNGVVFASSNAANRGQRIELARLPSPAVPRASADLSIGRPVAGRDLADSMLLRGARPSATPALPLRFMPLARTVALPEGPVIRIVVTLNPDYLANAFSLLIADTPRAAALLNADGTPIATTGAPLDAALDFAATPLIRTLLPHLEHGSFNRLPIGSQTTVGAYRAARRWPLVTVVATPEDTALAGWTALARGVALGTGVVLMLWCVLCAAAALGQLMREISSSEARNTAVLTSAMDGMVTLDALGHVVEFNREAERIFGYRAEHVIGQPGEALLPDEIHELMREHREPSDDDRLAPPRRRLELNARRANGRVFPAEISVAQIDVDDELFYFCTVRDLSEAKRVAHERAQLLAKYRDSSADLRGLKNALDEHAIVSILSPDGTILYANSMLASVSGYPSDELVGQSYRLLRPDDASGGPAVDRLPGLIREGAPWSGQLVHRRRDGSLF